MMKRSRSTAAFKPPRPALAKKAKTVGKQLGYQQSRALPVQPKAELKCYDVSETITNMNTAAQFYSLNAMNQGTEVYQRVGRKCYCKSLHFRGQFQAVNAGATEEVGRLLIVYDSQPNAAFPAIATLLQDANVGAATTINSSVNIAERERFLILRDKIYLLPATAANNAFTPSDTLLNSLNVNEFIKLKNIESVYNGTNGGTIADITSGAILMVMAGDATSDTNWTLNWQSRLRYYD